MPCATEAYGCGGKIERELPILLHSSCVGDKMLPKNGLSGGQHPNL